MRDWFRRKTTETAPEASLGASLEPTRSSWRDRFFGLFGPVDITDETWQSLEERLVLADVGVATAESIVAQVRAEARDEGARRADELWSVLARVLVRHLEADPAEPPLPAVRPTVLLMVGVNGTGKTTTIAKLAHRARSFGQRVVLVAGDTFRAAAIDQLQAWGERVAVPVLAGAPGADPAAVVFDALSSRAAQEADVVIVDTAGRLHTQANLMAELEKVNRVCDRVVAGAPHQTLLVLDATTGQNGLIQAKKFGESVGVTGLVLAKLDSSGRGGVALAVRRELGVPILFVGTGEGVADLAEFDADAFVDGLLAKQSEAGGGLAQRRQ